MPLKPAIIYDVAADTPSIKKAIGPKLAKQFSANPQVRRYAVVLKFPDGVVTSRAISHTLRKIPAPRGPTLLAGEDFTVEATAIAKLEGCDIVCVREFGWTDEAYASIRVRS
ncbi:MULTISPECIES: hypothetical protein [unclassified Bradyrhizobium]|uniref:hypothetical protein n=1 Tax=unclassified Bradyrhizobium TaxID=2631580 RepID=UPI0028EA9693|nr:MULTISPECIES: hypothetical protein [unclassified Bradyrhizobium]